MNKTQLGQIKAFAQPLCEKTGRFHAWDHIERVESNALSLAKHYPSCDLLILQAACYLHDIGRTVQDDGHPEESAKIAEPFLKEIGLTDDEIFAITHAVRSHDIDKIEEAQTIEAKLLFDADKIEILSVFGFGRTWTWLVEERVMDPTDALELLDRFMTKVYTTHIQTPEAKKQLNADVEFVQEFIKRYRAEL